MERLLEPIDPDDPHLWKVDKDRLEAATEIKRLKAERVREMNVRKDFVAEIERLRKDNLHWEHQNGLLEAEIGRLERDLKISGDRQVEAWAARDQYMASNVKLVAEIERLQAELRKTITRAIHEHNEETIRLQGEIERLQAKGER